MELKLVVVFANKRGLNRLGWTPEEYKPGIPMRRYVTGYFDTRVKVLEELDFDDKCEIFREARLAYAEAFIGQTVYLGQVELVCKPISQGDIRGVSVAVMDNPKLFAFRPLVTEVEVQVEAVELKSTHITKSQDESMEAARLPAVPQDQLPTLESITSDFRRFLAANPDGVGRSSDDLNKISGEYWEHDTRFIIPAERAEEITDLSRPMLTKLARTRKGMAESRKNQWFFSGKGLAEYLKDGRGKVGRPKTRDADFEE